MTENLSTTVDKQVEEKDILVVDDEPSVRGFIARVLMRNGYACRTASDPSEALSEAMRRAPALTISDVRMPGKDGSWLLTELKKRWPDMGVIMLTAVSEAKTAVQCLKAGAEDYLVKPIDLDELLIAVKRATEKTRLLRETEENRHQVEELQNRSAQLRDAFDVIESTYQEAIGALMAPAQSVVLGDARARVLPDSVDASRAEATVELSALRVAGKLISDGATYRDVATGIADDLVTKSGLACVRLWTTRGTEGLESVVDVGDSAPSGLSEIQRTLSAGTALVSEVGGMTWITCPVFLKGIPSDVLQLGSAASHDVETVALAERLSLVLAVALAREHDTRERQRTEEELDLFYKLAAASRHSLELEHVAEFLLGSIHRIVDYDAAGLLLLNDDPSLNIHTRFEASEQFTEMVKAHVLTNLKLTCGVEPPADLQIRERQTAPDGPERTEPQKLRSFVNVPLTVGGAVVGLIHVSSGRDQAFSEAEVLFVHRAANFLASSVQGIRELVAAVKGRVEQMVDHMSDGVLMLDHRGRIVAMNGAARHVLDCEDGGEESMNIERLAEPLGFDPLATVDAERRSLKRLVCLRGAAYQAQLSPIAAEDGALAGVVVAFRNFEEEKKLDELKSELVNVVSHELRTPLTAIKNAVSLLRGSRLGDLSEKQDHFLDLTQRNVEQLINIINDLLDLSKIEAGKMRIELQPMAMSVPVEAAVSSLKPQAESKGVILKTTIAPEIPLFHGNAASLQRVLVNLLGNAIKFTDRGEKVSVNVDCIEAADASSSAVRVSVTDSGVGVPEDQLESIFDKFHQVTGENRPTTVGTGLGLPISRELVRAHHGNIWAESLASGGSRFSFEIPVLTDQDLFFRSLSMEIQRTREQDAPLALAVVRIGNGEELERRLGPGHIGSLLDELRGCLLRIVRRSADQVVLQRDEAQIAVILPRTPRAGGRVFETRLRQEMEKSPLANAGAELVVSFAVSPDDAVSADELFEFANKGIGEAAVA